MGNREAGESEYALPKHVARLVNIISEQKPVHYKYLQSILPRVTRQELEHLDTYLNFCITQGLSIEYLAKSYLALVADAVNELIYFTQHGKYRYSTFREVADLVYFNEEYMSAYMHGLAISLVFWTSHLGIHRFFNEVLPRNQRGNYLEIGPGHGTFIMKAMQESTYDYFKGIDISETSIAQTRRILEHYIPDYGKACSLVAEDFFASDLQKESFKAIVMGEVLEHVEHPEFFLRKINELASSDAFIFITTCVNAPQLDHIYLFRTLDEVARLISSENFVIKNMRAIPYEGKTLEQCAREQLPINVAYVLAKQH